MGFVASARARRQRRGFLFLILALSAAPSALAATITWTGGGTTNNWSEAANWGGGVPAAGDVVAFPSGVSKLTTNNDLAVGTALSSIVVNGSGYVVNGNEISTTAGIDVQGSAGSLTLNAPIKLLASQTIHVRFSTINSSINLNGFNLLLASDGNSPASGVISGNGNVTLSGMRTTANNTYTGTTTITVNSAIDGSQPQSDVTLQAGLFGSGGSIGNLTVAGNGMVAPGSSDPCCSNTNGPGMLNTKNLAFNANSFFVRNEINGPTPGTGYDQLKVAGTVNIGANVNFDLTLSNSFTPSVGQVFTLIDNDGNDLIAGTFNGAAQGATLTRNSYDFVVSYSGGDGNDMTLTCTFAPKTWSGAVSGLWSAGGNWVGGAAPIAGDKLIFPAGPSTTTLQNDFPAGTQFNALIFSGSGYTVNGNQVALTAGIDVTSSGSITLNAPLKLLASQTIHVRFSTINSPIDLNGYNLVLASDGNSPANGVISGNGNVTLSAIRTTANNSYSGTTTITVNSAIEGSQPQSDVTVQGGLFGTGGSMGNVTVAGNGMVAPGSSDPCCSNTNGPGMLATKNLAFNANSLFVRNEINGPTPGTGYDQLKVAGTVYIAANVNFDLTLSNSFTPTVGQVFTLIDNDGNDPIVGTFNGFPQGATVSRNSFDFALSYSGGDGNDMTLTCTFAPKTWTGVVNGNWSVGGNWIGGVAPVAGDKLVFPAGPLTLTVSNNFPAGTVFNALIFGGSGYTVNGNEVGLTAGVDVQGSAGSITLNAPIKLMAAQTIAVRFSTINSPIDLNGFDLILSSYGNSPASGLISGIGNLTLSGMRTTANNTYTGSTTITVNSAVDGSQPQSNVTVQGGLFGTGGSMGNVTVNGNGMVAPGPIDPCCSNTNGPGMLTTKNLAFNANSLFVRNEINGASPGTGYDQIKVAGTVTIAANVNFDLALSPSFVPTIGQVFTLIDNDGTDAIAGTFNGRAEGSIVTLNGAYQFQFSYAGGTGNDFTATSLTGVQPTTTALIASANPSSVGQSVTFTATVTGSGGTPGGTIIFKDGPGTLGSVPLNLSGQAAFPTSALSFGTHPITAEYSGDSNFGAGKSAVLNQVVTAVSSTSLSSGPNPSIVGQAVTFSATVTSPSGIPAGSVTFMEGATTLASRPLTAGVATYTTSALPVGTHVVNAVYSGNGSFNGSASGNVSQVVNGLVSAATTTITALPTSIPADGTSTSAITVQVKDSGGVNVVTGGDSVVLSSNKGTLSPVTDHHDGTYGATLTSPTSPATATVSGTLNAAPINSTATVTFTCTATVASTSFSVNSTSDAPDLHPGDGICDAGSCACTLRAAIMEANALSAPVTVTVPTGTYNLTLAGPNEDASATGDLDIARNLTLNGAGAALTIIDGGGSDRVIEVRPGATVQISGVTLRNGNAGGGSGGGILNQGTLTLLSSTVSGSTAGLGGGIDAEGGTMNLINSSVTGNTATGVYWFPPGGGGIYVYGALTISGSTISGNTGSGIVNLDGTLTIVNSTISGNTSVTGYGGGGILNFSAFGGQGKTRIIGSTIAENRADGPPGFQGRGDAIGDAFSPAGNVTVKNSILASPTNGLGNDCYSGVFTSLGHNIASDISCGLSGPGDVNGANPLLGPLANNGGPTLTHALLTGSPAVDAVSDCTDLGGSPLTTDQRGTGRPQGSACDVGAFERVLPPCTSCPTITSVVPSNGPVAGGQSVSINGTNLGGATSVILGGNSANIVGNGAAQVTVTSPAHAAGSVNVTVNTPAGAATSIAAYTYVTTPTSTALAASLNQSYRGDLVTWTATVTPASATGQVSFFNGGAVLGSGVLAGGTATFSSASLPLGGNPIIAVYNGNANYAPSTSPALSHSVSAALSSTVVTAAPSPSNFGQNVTFTATVTPGDANGSVIFNDGSTLLGINTVAAGKASYSTAALPAGTHSIAATYLGDQNTASSNSAPYSHVVTPPPCPTAAPALLQPPAGATRPSPVTFQWTAVPNAPSYSLWYTVNFGPLIKGGSTTGTNLQLPMPSGPIAWFVQADFASPCSATISPQFSLTVSPANTCPTTPAVLFAPPNGFYFNAGQQVSFQWSPVANAFAYEVWMNANQTGYAPLGMTGATNFSSPLPIQGGTATWFVRTLSTGCPPIDSPPSPFSFAAQYTCPTASAQLFYPPNGATGIPSTVNFQWAPVQPPNGAVSRYEVYLVNGATTYLGSTMQTHFQTTLPTSSNPNYAWYVTTTFQGQPCPSVTSQPNSFKLTNPFNCLFAAAPPLVSPATGTQTTQPLVNFAWSGVAGATGYRHFLQPQSGSPTVTFTGLAVNLSKFVPVGASQWWVEALFTGCPNQSSPHRTIKIAACQMQPPVPSTPVVNAQQNAGPVTFHWAPAHSTLPSTLINYQLFVNSSSSAASLATGAGNSGTMTLLPGQYTWFVRATEATGAQCTTQSVPRAVIINSPPPPCPAPQPPIVYGPGAATSGNQYTIYWQPVAGAGAYDVYSNPGNAVRTSSLFMNFTANLPQGVFSGTATHQVRSVSNCSSQLSFFSNPIIVNLSKNPFGSFLGMHNGPSTTFGYNQSISLGSLSGQNIPAPRGAAGFSPPMTPTSSSFSPGGVNPAAPQAAQASQAAQAAQASRTSRASQAAQASPASRAAQAPLTFALTTDQPWLKVSPSTVTLGGTEEVVLKLEAETAELPIGANKASIIATAQDGTRALLPTALSLTGEVSSTSIAPAPDALIIPVVGHVGGYRSQWQSDVRVANTGATPVTYALRFTPTDTDGTAATSSSTFDVQPGETVALDDVVQSWFGVLSGTGSLELRAITDADEDSGATPMASTVVSSRTYTTSGSGTTFPEGTYGQFVPAIPRGEFVSKSGDSADVLTLLQIAQSSRFRTNLGLVEGSGEPATARVRVYDKSGGKLTELSVPLQPGEQKQLNGFLEQRGIAADDARVDVDATSGSGRITAYASVIDNVTSDPIFVSPVRRRNAAARLVIPGIADLDGAAARWTSDVRIFNPGAAAAQATLTFTPQDSSQTPATGSVTIAPGTTRTLDSIVRTFFGRTNAGGALTIAAADGQSLIASARTYATQGAGTYGQFIPALNAADGAGRDGRTLQFVQVEESENFRSNLGVMETAGAPATVEVTARRERSDELRTLTLTLRPNEFVQLNSVLRQMGLPKTYNARLAVRVTAGDGKIAAYVSMIDNRTQDPTYIPAQ